MRSHSLQAARAFAAASSTLLMSGCVVSPETPPTTTAPAAEALVVVTIDDLAGLDGGGVATTLFVGGPIEDIRYEDGTPVPAEGIGGFGALVDSDPFTVTSPIMVPDRMGTGVFPYVTDEPLRVEPGTYTLYVWADTTPLAPFSRWVPGMVSDDPDGVRSCETTFEVGSQDVEMSIRGVPLIDEAMIATCELE